MLETVKHVMSAVGTPTGEFVNSFATGSARVAKRVGGATADVARRIGPKRALIGIAVIGAAVAGTIAVIRYLRARDAAGVDTEANDISDKLAAGSDSKIDYASLDGNAAPQAEPRAAQAGARDAALTDRNATARK
jgi:hypothetical protein